MYIYIHWSIDLTGISQLMLNININLDNRVYGSTKIWGFKGTHTVLLLVEGYSLIVGFYQV